MHCDVVDNKMTSIYFLTDFTITLIECWLLINETMQMWWFSGGVADLHGSWVWDMVDQDRSAVVACDCNGLSNRCFFDEELYRKTGHSGHCLDCRENTFGIHCERCKDYFYRAEPQDKCQACDCDNVGKLPLCVCGMCWAVSPSRVITVTIWVRKRRRWH